MWVLASQVACVPSNPEISDCGAVRARYLFGGDRFSQTIQQFESFDLETRYRIYICGSQGYPRRDLADLFAEGGAEAAHFLADKLGETTYRPTIYDIVVVFALMQSMRTFDATSDPAIMTLVERKVSILDGSQREWGERYLQTIRNGPGAPLPVPKN